LAGLIGSWAEKLLQARRHCSAGPSALAEVRACRRMRAWQGYTVAPAVLSPASLPGNCRALQRAAFVLVWRPTVQPSVRVKRGPALSAGLIRLPGDAVRCLCVGRGCVRCSRQCVRTGPAESAGLTALSSDAAPCRRVGRDHVMCRPTTPPEWIGHAPRAYPRGIPRANSRGSFRRRSGHTRAPWVAQGRGGSPAPASQTAGTAVGPTRPCRH